MISRFAYGVVVGVICAGLGTVVACSDDDKSSPTTTPDSGAEASSSGSSGDAASTDGVVTGTATYNGALKGTTLYVSLFEAFPPAAAPVAIGRIDNVGFPGSATFTIKAVPAGTWYLAAYYNIGPEHSMGPEDSDPQGTYIQMGPTAITVAEGQTVTGIDFELMDPAPADAGTDADAGDGGDGG